MLHRSLLRRHSILVALLNRELLHNTHVIDNRGVFDIVG
jgi:hypothetical protein